MKQIDGIVLKSTGSWYKVKSKDNKIFDCQIRGKIRTQAIKSTNPVSVGDFVLFIIMEDGTGLIQDIKPRKNYIVRQSTNLSKKKQVLASNIDQAIIVVSLRDPETPTEFIDRFLLSTEVYEIPAKIIFNKIDIYNKLDLEKLDELINTYERIGYNCFKISAKEEQNISEIIELLKDKTSVLAGNSGVGKSTLINKVSPNLFLKTEEISEKYRTGKHTTTFTEMHELIFGGYIIDTPGIRAFGIDFIEKDLIAHNFPEMFNLLGKCKYYNCKHIDEPGCEVKKAIERGEISYSRYRSYLSMMLEEKNKYRQ